MFTQNIARAVVALNLTTALVFSLFSPVVPVAKANNVDNPNDYPYWCANFDGGVKFDPPVDGTNDGITADFHTIDNEVKKVDVSSESSKSITLVVVKGGNDDNDGNATYSTGPFTNLEAPITPNNQKTFEISHVIVCYDNVPDPDTGRIKVRKIADDNASGSRDDNESQLGGWIINIYNNQWSLVDSVVTDQSKWSYSEDLLLDTYYLCEVGQNGWVQVKPNSGNALNLSANSNEAEYCYEVVLNKDGQTKQRSFYNQYTEPQVSGSITIVKEFCYEAGLNPTFNDCVTDVTYEDDILVKIDVRLGLDENSDGQEEPLNFDSNGHFSVTLDRDFDTYFVCEMLSTDYILVSDYTITDGCVEVELNENNPTAIINYKNFDRPSSPQVDYCDPAQRPAGKSIAQWLTENQINPATCFDFVVLESCGQFDAYFTRNDTGLDYEFRYVLGDSMPLDWQGDGTPPALFDEDQNGGSVTLTYYVVGAEKDYFVGTSIPNFWDGEGETVIVDTDCGDEEPTYDLEITKLFCSNTPVAQPVLFSVMSQNQAVFTCDSAGVSTKDVQFNIYWRAIWTGPGSWKTRQRSNPHLLLMA